MSHSLPWDELTTNLTYPSSELVVTSNSVTFVVSWTAVCGSGSSETRDIYVSADSSLNFVESKSAVCCPMVVFRICAGYEVLNKLETYFVN